MDGIAGKRMKDGTEHSKHCLITWSYPDCRRHSNTFLIFCFDCKCLLSAFITEGRGVKTLDEKPCAIFGNLYFHCLENFTLSFMTIFFVRIFYFIGITEIL